MGLPFNWNKWFEVQASMSFGSSESGVIGRSFSIASTSHKIVCRASSSNTCWFATEHNTLFTSCTKRSHTSPWWARRWGLKVHFMPSCMRLNWILLWFSSNMACFNSRFELTKLVPLSEQNSLTCPQWQMNLLKAFIEESISRECATSRWTARQVTQVKRTLYLLTELLPLFI